MESILVFLERLTQLGVILGMLGMTGVLLVAFAIYLYFLPSSVEVYAPQLDEPALPVPKK